MSLWLRWYRLVLRLLPHGFRTRHESEMMLCLAERLANARGQGHRAVMVIRASCDVIRQVLRAPRFVELPTRMAMIDSLMRDVTQAVRGLRRTPGFTCLATLTLGTAIGANTVIFSLVNGVLLRPLPYESADRIGIIWHDLGNGAQSLPALNALDFFDYRERAEAFEAFTIATGRERILGGVEAPELIDVGMVAADFFDFFGVRIHIGRGIRPEEDVPGGPRVTVLSYGLWQRRFGGDSSVIGNGILVNDDPHEVVGILPPGFRLFLPPEAFRLRDADLWVPVAIDRDGLPPRNYTGFTVFGRLREGITWPRAQRDMDRMEAQLRQEHAVHEASNLQVRVVPLHDDVVKEARTGLHVLFASVGFVLMIACANVAMLLLARGNARGRELAVRQALGASRRALQQLVLVESLVLAVLSGILGLMIAQVGMEFVAGFAATSVPRMADAAIDGVAFAFVMVLIVATALVFGAIPAFQSSQHQPRRLLTDRFGTGDRQGFRLRQALVAGEVALSVILLVGAALTIRSFVALKEIRPGFDPENRLTMRVSLPPLQFGTASARRAFWDELRARLSGIPEVRNVAATTQLPLTGSGPLQPFAYNEETAANWESVTADERGVTPEFFSTMGATMIAGREFTNEDHGGDRDRIIIDQTLAALAFPDGDAVGRYLQIDRDAEAGEFAEVVGVVDHLHLHDVSRATLPQLYRPLIPGERFVLVVETNTTAPELLPRIQTEVRALSPGIPLENVVTMSTLLDRRLTDARLSLWLMTVFGGIALLLSAGGLYAVVAYAVTQRAREIGIKMALGQTPNAVTWSILRDTVRIVVPSVVIGLGSAALLGRLMSSLLYGVRPTDGPSYAVVTVLLIGTAVVASWAPALRATRGDPLAALRAE